MSNLEKIFVIGGGGHARSVIDVLKAEDRFQVAGIFDPEEAAVQALGDYRWLGREENIEKYSDQANCAVIAIGDLKNEGVRVRVFKNLQAKWLEFPVIISPHAYVAPDVAAGAGSVIMHRAVVNSGVRVGKNSIINTAAVLEHDSELGAHSHVATAAVVNGECRIGERVLVGSGAVIKNCVSVVDDVIIGAGGVVIKDITEPGTYVGNPVRRIKA